jgi:nitroreductase
MDFFEVVNKRHSIRAYERQPLDPQDLQRIFEAISRAPSAGNLQAFEVYMVCDILRKEALVLAAGDQEFLAQAPVVLVFCAHGARSAGRYSERGANLYAVQDASIACTYAMLAATALGLATVWVGAFDEQRVREVIGASSAERPVSMLPVGYAAGPPRNRPRRSLQDVVHSLS